MNDDAAFAALGHDEQAGRLGALAIATATARYGLRAARCELLQYEHNAVFAITSGERYAVRIAPPTAALPALRAEMAWLAALRHDTALRVPEPVVASDGERVVTATYPGVPGPRHVVVLRWIDGVRLEGEPLARLAAPLAEAVAVLHHHGERFQLPVGERPTWGVPRLLADGAVIAAADRRRVGAGLAALVARAIAAARSALDAMGGAGWGLIHGDLHLDNILVGAGGIAFIDFDDAGWGHALYDVATLLDAARRRGLAPGAYRTFRADLLRAYGALRPLPSSLDADLATFRAVREIATLAFIAGTGNAEVAAWGDERTAEIERGLADYLRGRSDL
jgi:Ser/Thr protein kinase RdoA (MazF antagonist)